MVIVGELNSVVQCPALSFILMEKVVVSLLPLPSRNKLLSLTVNSPSIGMFSLETGASGFT
jgi:hypothetical protein